MLNLCKITDPSIKLTSDDISKLLDPRQSLHLVNRSTVTPRQFIDWVKATVTDETVDTHLLSKSDYYNIFADANEARKFHGYQLTKQIFTKHPKWLTEFCRIGFSHDGSFQFEIGKPKIAENPEERFNYTYSNSQFTYLGASSNPYADNYYYTGDVSISDENLASIHQILDELEASFSVFLDMSPNVDAPTESDRLFRSSYHTQVLSTLYSYLCDRSIISYRHAHSGYDSIRPSTAFTRMNAIPDDFRSRIQYKVDWADGRFLLVYTEPRQPATRDYLANILNYSTNVLDVLPFNIRGKKEQVSPLYGIELEACSNYSPATVIAAQQELFFILKQDGSISGEGRYKYEMVTVPATFKAHKRLWAEFFNKIDYTQFDTSKSTGNGMHVHIDRNAFKAKGHLNRFTWFFINPANLDLLYEMSERPSKSDMFRWAPVPTLLNTKIVTMFDTVRSNRGCRGVIHFKGQSTVEIRLFKGVVSYATIVKNLEFVDSMFHFTQVTSLTNITLPNYLAWLASQPKNRYTMVREFLSQLKNIDQLLLGNELKEYLFTANKPEVVLEKLQKAKFKVTNKHLTILNRERRKRTFILDKAGQLQLAFSNAGKLASLDKELQAKMTRGSSTISFNLV